MTGSDHQSTSLKMFEARRLYPSAEYAEYHSQTLKQKTNQKKKHQKTKQNKTTKKKQQQQQQTNKQTNKQTKNRQFYLYISLLVFSHRYANMYLSY